RGGPEIAGADVKLGAGALEGEVLRDEVVAPPVGAPPGACVPPEPPPPRPAAGGFLGPAWGFPAVIVPRPGASRNPADSDATRTICVLLLSNVPTLTSHDAARYLRCVKWEDRKRRTIQAGDPGSFSPDELTVRNGLVERGGE